MGATRNRVQDCFGIVLKAARDAAGLKQEELAAIADFEASYISLLEHGKRQPTITAIMAIEQALELSPGELVRRTSMQMGGKQLIVPPPKRITDAE
jgi:transcriptional regulator with XRE-family HTH domain